MIPTYCPPGKQTLTGYTVSESITVKLRDLSKAGALLTYSVRRASLTLNGPSFAVDDPNAVQDQARTKAIADARSKANELAKELGVHLVRVVSFTDNNNGVIRPVMYAMNASVGAAAPAAAPTPEVPLASKKYRLPSRSPTRSSSIRISALALCCIENRDKFNGRFLSYETYHIYPFRPARSRSCAFA